MPENVDVSLLQRRHLELEAEVQRLKSGGGGGTSDGMDPWQTSVEKRLDGFDGRLRTVEVQLATLVERVSHLPTKSYFVTVVTAATAVLMFADKIKAFAGIH